MNITAIILTGGKSSRMGTDKALLVFEGETLLQRAVGFCRSFCDEVLISSDFREHEVDGGCRIPDQRKDCGPMGGIYSCMQESSNQWNFVWSVDAPFVKKEFIGFLMSVADEVEAVVPVHGGKKEPLIALYHRNTLPAFQAQLDSCHFKMHSLLERIQTRFVDATDWEEKFPGIFENLNYPEDLR
jgi:molybdopterin-guanine dinucleotide biosynthesis protein A